MPFYLPLNEWEKIILIKCHVDGQYAALRGFLCKCLKYFRLNINGSLPEKHNVVSMMLRFKQRFKKTWINLKSTE